MWQEDEDPITTSRAGVCGRRLDKMTEYNDAMYIDELRVEIAKLRRAWMGDWRRG